MKVLEAIYTPGDPDLQVKTDQGTFYLPTQKAAVLQQGYCFAYGDDLAAGRIETITGVVPSDVLDGRPFAQEVEGVVDDPIVLELARRHTLGEYGDQATPGAVPIPTFEEADGAQYTYDLGRLRRQQ